ncbi:MAG: SUF system NifU family Fe-S cluster assembly protein [Bacilli bacterium]|nr:SUF system NifU family Fe-S cluster assembly protein [Bacilli bacterium]
MPTFELNPQMMREIIMDHYSNPRHKGVPTDEGYTKTQSSAVNCIDDIDIYLKSSNGKVVDAMWEGTACTISTASTDIVCEQCIGKDYKDSLYMIEQYLKMIDEKEYDDSVLDEAIVFMNTGKQAARIHCATMGWTALKEMLEAEEKKGN